MKYLVLLVLIQIEAAVRPTTRPLVLTFNLLKRNAIE